MDDKVYQEFSRFQILQILSGNLKVFSPSVEMRVAALCGFVLRRLGAIRRKVR